MSTGGIRIERYSTPAGHCARRGAGWAGFASVTGAPAAGRVQIPSTLAADRPMSTAFWAATPTA